MNPLFLPALKNRLQADLVDLRLEWHGPVVEGEERPNRPAHVFIGDLPPKKRLAGEADTGDPFPCVLIVPTSGQSSGQTDDGEDAVTVALICGVYCGDEGDAEGAETDLALLLSRIRQSLFPCLKNPLDSRYRLTEDAKGRLFSWEKSDMQPRPYLQATLMTHWRMKGLE